MSHFTVMVIGDNSKEQLAPFDESIKEIDKKIFIDKEEEFQEEWNKNTIEVPDWYPSFYETVTSNQLKELIDKKIVALNNIFDFGGMRIKEGARIAVRISEKPKDIVFAKIRNYKAKEKSIYDIEIEFIESPAKKLLQDKYENFEDFVKQFHGYSNRDEIQNKYGYWENPNAHWDWYQLGGRFKDSLRLKPEYIHQGTQGTSSLVFPKESKIGYTDSALKKHIDFKKMNQENFDRAEEAYNKFEEAYKKDKELKTFNPYFDYGVENISDKKDEFIPEDKIAYIKRNASFYTFAVIKDGKWYERGEMGWWGAVSNEQPISEWIEQFNKMLEEIPEDTLISIYDCHI